MKEIKDCPCAVDANNQNSRTQLLLLLLLFFSSKNQKLTWKNTVLDVLEYFIPRVLINTPPVQSTSYDRDFFLQIFARFVKFVNLVSRMDNKTLTHALLNVSVSFPVAVS